MKKQFYVKALIDVTEDNYENGELGNVNYYDVDGIIPANTSKSAIKQFFNNKLCFDINFDYLEYNEEDKSFNYTVLCDVDNWEIKKESNIFMEWKKGNINLYNNYISLYIYELSAINTL